MIESDQSFIILFSIVFLSSDNINFKYFSLECFFSGCAMYRINVTIAAITDSTRTDITTIEGMLVASSLLIPT